MKSTIKKTSKKTTLMVFKKLSLIIIFILSINKVSAQSDFYASIENNDLALHTLNGKASLKFVTKTTYNEVLKTINFSKHITDLQGKIRAYDIEKSSVYDNSERALYNVSFKGENSKAHVVYNNEGDIIKSTEVYKNVKLPLRLRIKILGNNPMYEIASNKVKISYHRFFGVSISYKIVLHNGKKRKTLKFDQDYNSI